MEPPDDNLESLARVVNKFIVEVTKKNNKKSNAADRAARENLDRDIKEDLERINLCIEIMSIIASNKT